MNRSDLGTFGASLPDGEVAQALVALAVVAPHGPIPFPPLGIDALEKLLIENCTNGLCELPTWWLDHFSMRGDDNAPALAGAWQRFLVGRPPPRLEILPNDRDSEASSWLANQARHSAVGAGSVYLRIDEPAWPVAWEWPLRLGVLGPRQRSGRGAALAKALEALDFPQLWTVVDMNQPGAECELLLLPGDLRRALADVLAAAQRPRADCVLVLGGANQMSIARRLALATALRRESRTAGVATLGAGSALAKVLSNLVRELSHNATLDVALFTAAREARLPAPELMFSHSLAAHSSIRLTAARMAHQFSRENKTLVLGPAAADPGGALTMAPPSEERPALAAAGRADPVPDVLARRLEDLANSGEWLRESADASDLVHIRADIVRSSGQRHRGARLRTASPPQPVEEADQRQVLAQVLEHGAAQPTQHLKAERGYRLRVKIAIPQAGFAAAGEAFPSHELPPSQSGHELEVSFVPLSADGNDQRAAPQQQQIFLPPAGESTAAEFVFGTHGLQGAFRGRLLVSHDNRIVQMLRLDGELNAEGLDAPRPYSFGVENMVYPGFHNLAYQAPFDAALVINHSPQGAPGITTLAGSQVSFVEPAGMAAILEKLQATLSNETALRKTASSLDAKPITDLIFALMQHGRLLYDYVESQLGTLDSDAGRIQLVEARPGAFFPLEFLYPLEVPQAKPPLCPHAKTALAGGTSHQDCTLRDDPDHMCPMRFWGFRKQIERQPPGPATAGPHTLSLSVPTPLNGKLNLFASAQVARSTKVQAADYDLPKGLLKVMHEAFQTVGTPGSWPQWKSAVAQQSPGFLLLLSHSTVDGTSELPALEISSDVLSVASIEASYVKGPAAAAPVVFLLGCSTKDASLGFLDFVARFKGKQAALVVGTLSTISAQRAARFLELALPILRKAEGSGRSFGDVFLDIRRAALAKGDGFVFSLVAYGDIGWQL